MTPPRYICGWGRVVVYLVRLCNLSSTTPLHSSWCASWIFEFKSLAVFIRFIISPSPIHCLVGGGFALSDGLPEGWTPSITTLAESEGRWLARRVSTGELLLVLWLAEWVFVYFLCAIAPQLAALSNWLSQHRFKSLPFKSHAPFFIFLC